MHALTARQSEVLHFIAQFIQVNGYSPTYEEICDHFGFQSKQAASGHVKALERKGYIKKTPGRSRTIKLTQRPRQSTRN